MAGAIAIAFNLKDSAGSQVTAANFTTAQVCKIFSGTITSWNDAGLSGAFSLPAGHSIPAQPINVAYRLDNNGTTLAFSNYLSNNCGSAGLSHVFETGQTFGSTTSSGGGTPAPGSVISQFFTTLPNTWTAYYGERSVGLGVTGTPYSVGYIDTSHFLALTSLGMSSIELANVNGKSPITNFGSALTLSSATLVYNQVFGAFNNTNGTATLAAISGPPATQCIALVPPADYAVAGSKGGLLSSASYPIVAISYLLGNSQSNGVDIAATKKLLNAPYNSTIKSAVSTSLIGPGTGLAFLTLGSGAFTATAPGDCLY